MYSETVTRARSRLGLFQLKSSKSSTANSLEGETPDSAVAHGTAVVADIGPTPIPTKKPVLIRFDNNQPSAISPKPPSPISQHTPSVAETKPHTKGGKSETFPVDPRDKPAQLPGSPIPSSFSSKSRAVGTTPKQPPIVEPEVESSPVSVIASYAAVTVRGASPHVHAPTSATPSVSLQPQPLPLPVPLPKSTPRFSLPLRRSPPPLSLKKAATTDISAQTDSTVPVSTSAQTDNSVIVSTADGLLGTIHSLVHNIGVPTILLASSMIHQAASTIQRFIKHTMARFPSFRAMSLSLLEQRKRELYAVYLTDVLNDYYARRDDTLRIWTTKHEHRQHVVCPDHVKKPPPPCLFAVTVDEAYETMTTNKLMLDGIKVKWFAFTFSEWYSNFYVDHVSKIGIYHNNGDGIVNYHYQRPASPLYYQGQIESWKYKQQQQELEQEAQRILHQQRQHQQQQRNFWRKFGSSLHDNTPPTRAAPLLSFSDHDSSDSLASHSRTTTGRSPRTSATIESSITHEPHSARPHTFPSSSSFPSTDFSAHMPGASFMRPTRLTRAVTAASDLQLFWSTSGTGDPPDTPDKAEPARAYPTSHYHTHQRDYDKHETSSEHERDTDTFDPFIVNFQRTLVRDDNGSKFIAAEQSSAIRSSLAHSFEQPMPYNSSPIVNALADHFTDNDLSHSDYDDDLQSSDYDSHSPKDHADAHITSFGDY